MKNKKNAGIDAFMKNIQTETPDGAFTLGGFVQEHFNDLCKEFFWRATSTKKAHLSQLVNTVIPAIEDHDVTPIHAYSAGMIEKTISNIAAAGKIRGRNGEKIPYDQSTLDGFERLLRQFVEYAEKLNICAPIDDNRQSRRQSKKSAKRKARAIVRRHMSPMEEVRFLIAVLLALIECGEARLAILCYGCGLRPSEACGLNWDTIEFSEESNVNKVSLPQSVEPGYSRPKPTMKAPNGHRVIITNKLVYDLLMLAKKELLERWIAEGHAAAEFEHLPLGAKRNSLTKRCANYDISQFVNNIFEQIGIRKNELDGLKDEMTIEYEELLSCGEDVDANDYIDPSTYLLRHVYATSNVPLLFTVAMRQYYQGHKIDDPAISRRIMTTSAVQKIVQKKREQHPLLSKVEKKEFILEEGTPLTVSGYKETVVVPPGKSAEISILADEPGDTIVVTIRNADEQEMTGEIRLVESWRDPPEEGYNYPINVQRFYHELYAPAAKMLLEAFPGLYDGIAPWRECEKTECPLCVSSF